MARRSRLPCLALAGALVLAGTLSACRRKPATSADATVATRDAALPAKNALGRLRLPGATGFSAAVARVARSVVNLGTTRRIRGGPLAATPFATDDPESGFFGPRSQVENSLGSGVVVDGEGLVATSARVIGEADPILVRLDGGGVFPARLLGRDVETDLALLRVEAKEALSALRPALLGDSDGLTPGDFVVAVGNPFATGPWVAAGVLQSSGRTAAGTTIGSGLWAFLRTDAAVDATHAGGALVDSGGEVVGIVSSPASAEWRGLAIPANLLRRLVPRLAGQGRVARGYLGLYALPVSPAQAAAAGLEAARGALVGEVVEGGPAAAAGVRSGDILLELDGRRIEQSTNLLYLAALVGPAKKVSLRLLRDGQQRSIVLTTAELPE